jgi:hypothetical protein
MVASSRLRNSGVNTRLISTISSPACLLLVKPMPSSASILAGVGRHDDDHVAEIGLAPVVVGQRPVVHHLQQDVEDVRVRLLDLVEQQHAVRLLGERLGQQAALVEADVARRRADQPLTAWRSMYSDMSKRTSSMPRQYASCRATSVLPTPVGPENRNCRSA